MNDQSQFVDEKGPIGVREYDDGTELLVADVGVGREASVDVVGETAIVVTGGDQYEFQLPGTAEDAQAFMKNGVLTIEVNA
jgi:hypothetical protein